MHDDSIRSEIRNTDAEEVLLAAEAAGGQLPYSGVVEAVRGDGSAGSYAAATLRRLGLVSEKQSMAGEITLTPQGRRIAQAVLNSRRNGPERWDAVERAIAESVRNGGGWEVGDVGGVPVTNNETRLAVSNLEQWGLVTAGRNAGDEIYWVMARDRIHQVPGVDGLLKDHFEGRASINAHSSTTNIGDGNVIGGVQTGGHANTQNVTLTSDTRSAVVSQLTEILTGLPNDVDARVREPLEAARA